MAKKIWLSIFMIFYLVSVIAQRDIRLDDIWTNFTFTTKSITGLNFMNDGEHFSKLEGNAIHTYRLATGEYTGIIMNGDQIKGQDNFMGSISDYNFNNTEEKILIKSETESIYRRSTKARFHVYDIQSKTVTSIFEEGKIMYATFSPDSKKVAFIYKNNLYYRDLSKGTITQVTFDGKENEIINGASDWVYEEEFGLSKAFEWSPDSKKIAFIRFDESEVREYIMTQYNNDLYPQYTSFKYPKVGEHNAKVKVVVYDLEKGKPTIANIEGNDFYIPRSDWITGKNQLLITQLNRDQNHLRLLLMNEKDGDTRLVLEEKSHSYIQLPNDIYFINNGKAFLRTSEKSGFIHIYLYNIKGEEVSDLTPGNYDVNQIYGFDEKHRKVYFQASPSSPIYQQVFSVDIESLQTIALSPADGYNNAQFNQTFDHYILEHSTFNSPPVYQIMNKQGELIRVLEDNQQVSSIQEIYQVSNQEFFSFKSSDELTLNGWMIKPNDFDEEVAYPLLMFVYGGPGSQEVLDKWKGNNYWWFQYLAHHGYVIACVDGRGTGGRGESFKKITYRQLGHYETIDQISAAKYLGKLPFIDQQRIGIFGWSYGGFISTNCLFKGNDVFHLGIAVAPVTHWKWYNTIYTERYMNNYTDNPSGYDNNSPIKYADRLEGHYLLVHGSSDDNVHFQHSAELIKALVKANKQFDSYVYPNRNHGIYGDNARLHLYTKMSNFIFENL